MASEEHCQAALDQHQDFLSGLDNVVGLGVTPASDEAGPEAEMAVAVYVSRKLPPEALREGHKVPEKLRIRHRGELVEVPARVVEVGEITFGPADL